MLTNEEIKKYKEEGYLVPNFQMPEKDILEIEEPIQICPGVCE